MFPRIERSGTGNQGAARRPGARVGQLAAALIVLTAVAGCSSSSSPSAPSSPAGPSTPAAPSSTSAPAAPPSATVAPPVTGPPACATSSLSVTLGPSSGYAGGVYQTIVFTNTSGTTCTLFGYPGVSLVSAPPYKQIGLAAQRGSTVPVRQITLVTGAAANAVLQVVDALNFGSATCSPTQAAFLRVYPPNQTVPVFLPDTSRICAQPVQTLFISAVQAGAGGPA